MTKQTKWLLGFVAALVIANLAMAASIWLKKEVKTAPPQGDAREYLVKSLSLDTRQTEAFDELRKGHFMRLREYREEMRELKDALFDQLRWPRNARADSLAKQIGELQATIDLETFEHFSQLRTLLNDDQTKKFDTTIQHVLRTMGPRGPMPGHHPPDRKGPPPHGEGPDGRPPFDRPDGPPPGEGPPH